MLLDTGADICLVKLHSLADDTWIDDTTQSYREYMNR